MKHAIAYVVECAGCFICLGAFIVTSDRPWVLCSALWAVMVALEGAQ